MWNVKTLEIQNPAGLLIDSKLDWSGETFVFGPQREVLFIALSQGVLRPESRVSLGFNPRAQMFRSLQNIFTLAEKLLSMNSAHPDEGKIGAMVSNRELSPDDVMQISSVQKMIRAEVTLFLASVSVNSTHLSKAQILRMFEYLASVNSQTDEMLPIAIEQVLGRSARDVYELLTSHIFFYRASGLGEIRKKLYEAEHVLSGYVAAMRLPEWKNDQVAPAYVLLDGSLKQRNAVFVPFSSSSTDTYNAHSLEEVCSFLLKNGVSCFYSVDSFVERLRWVERIAIRRQLNRLDAVRVDPLRAQAFFDARAGRNSFIVLSDQGHAILQQLVADFGLANFEMDVQEMIATSLEIYELRSSVSIFKDPWYDLIAIVKTLTEVDSEKAHILKLDDALVIRRLMQQGEFP